MKGTIRLQQYGNTNQLRIVCRGYNSVGDITDVSVGNLGAGVCLPIDSPWDLKVRNALICRPDDDDYPSQGIEFKYITLTFGGGNICGLQRIKLKLPLIEEVSTKEFVWALKEHSHYHNLSFGC